MKKFTMLFSLLTILFMTGCSIPVEIGRPVELTDIQAIEKNMTSQQVKDRLGEPMASGRDNHDNQTWTWYHLRATLPVKANTDPELQRVTITLNSDGRVLSIDYDMSKPTK